MPETSEGGDMAQVQKRRQSAKRRRSVGAAGTEAQSGGASEPTSARPHGRSRSEDSGTGAGSGRTVKKSVTLSETVAEEIEARTGARGFSQFIDAAAERYLALLKAQEIVEEHTSRLGDFTADQLAEAESAWRGE